jgi:uncharacterized membrane protein
VKEAGRIDFAVRLGQTSRPQIYKEINQEGKMIPLIVLLVSFVGFRLAGFGVAYFADWQHALCAALGVMFLLTASAHRGKRRPDLVRMVPRGFGNAEAWVTMTGIAEALIAVGLQFPRTALPVAAAAVVMLVCLFPANLRAAREGLTIGGRPVPGWRLRLLIQIVFVTALVAAVWRR